MQARWYVVQTRPKKEAIVSGLLGSAHFQVFLPRIRRFGRGAVPLFPRYCFLRTDLHDPAVHHCVRFTRGVTRILGDEVGPVALDDEVVETIRATTEDGSVIEQLLLYRPMDRVIVKGGILRDLVGIVEKNIPDSGRVRVLFKWLSRKLTADVDYRLLEKVV